LFDKLTHHFCKHNTSVLDISQKLKKLFKQHQNYSFYLLFVTQPVDTILDVLREDVVLTLMINVFLNIDVYV